MRSGRSGVVVWCATVASLIACSGERTTGDTHVTRDSAGITIVESAGPAWAGAPQWTIDSIQEVEIGEADDDALHRIASPLVLNDGRIAFFNGGSCEVRFHEDSGAHQLSSGRCGEGPGEFEEFASLWPWRGDSILVVDRINRMTILAPDGTPGSTRALEPTNGMPLPLVRGVMRDGTLLVAGLRNPGAPPAPGIETGESSLALLGPNDSVPIAIGSFPGPTFEYTEFNGSIGRGMLAFSSATEFTAAPNHIFVGFPDRYEIQVYDDGGSLQRIVRRSWEPVRVQTRDIDWLMERRLGQVEGEENQRIVRQAFRDLRYAETMPAFGTPVWPGGAEGGPSMLSDADGNLWVFEHYRPGEYRNDWTVFDEDGVWLGTVALPLHFTPRQIGHDFVIGRSVGDDGFAHIRRYRIRR